MESLPKSLYPCGITMLNTMLQPTEAETRDSVALDFVTNKPYNYAWRVEIYLR